MGNIRNKLCTECGISYYDDSLRNQRKYCSTYCKNNFDYRVKKQRRKTKAIETGTIRHDVTTAEFSEDVSKITGGEYNVVGKYVNSKTPITIKHIACGNEYTVRPYAFKLGNRCPKCCRSSSKGEMAVERYLKKYNMKYTKEYITEVKIKTHPLRIDFFVEGVAIEFDGIQHFEPIDHFGGERTFRETQRRDAIKDKYCADNGIPLIRIPYWDFDNIDAILTEKLLPLLEKRAI